MKQRGFTLIEVIASLFILSIGVMGTSIIVSSSRGILIHKETSYKNMNYAMGIAEYYQSKEEEEILNLCIDEEVSFYIYFSNINELALSLEDAIVKIGKVDDSFLKCLELNTDKFYGAYVNFKLVDDSFIPRGKLYDIKIKVWSLRHSATSVGSITISRGAVER